MDVTDEYLTIDEVSKLLRVSVFQLARWRKSRIGPSYRTIGRQVLYPKSLFSDWKTKTETIAHESSHIPAEEPLPHKEHVSLPPYLTAREVAERLRVSPRTLAQLITTDDSPPRMKIGQKFVFPSAALIAWEKERQTGGKTKEKGNAKKFLTPQEVASRLHSSLSTLARWRMEGCGPKFSKIGKGVIYPIKELEKWEDERLVSNSGEALQHFMYGRE